MSETIYRFKFSEKIKEPMIKFANVHRFDETPDFKEAWNRWYDDNSELIEEESTRLNRLGCDKNIDEKMYKSVRYYFKNKSSEKKKPKKRRQYIMIEQLILNLMSEHIEICAFPNNYKPEYAYNNFVSNQIFNKGKVMGPGEG